MRDFFYTIGTLVKSYLNDTLQHGNCHACAVGNIVAESNKINFSGTVLYNERKIWDDKTKTPHWQNVFITSEDEQICRPDLYEYEAKRQIDATGYSWQQLSRIEYAFETAPMGNNNDEHMFNGLMAVVDVLADIHGIDLTQKEEAKALFVK